jgi:hypothetical protein
MDEGLPIAYQVLDDGVPVYSSDGELIGTVDHCVSAPAQDIFHGIVVVTSAGRVFVPADQIASLHERGVDLGIDAAAARTLPKSTGSASAWHVDEPGVRPSRWRHVLDMLEGQGDKRRGWRKED